MSGIVAGALAVIVVVLPGPPGGGDGQQPPVPQASSPQASSPQASSPQASSPQPAYPPAAYPPAPSPQAASPQVSSPQAAYPQAASPWFSPSTTPSPPIAGSALPDLGHAVGGVPNGVENGVNGVASAVDLSGWKLTLPKASEKGTAASINPADSAPPYLTRDGNGCLKFWAPVNGATTPNSQHPRTELVSLNNFKAGTGQHTLRASVSVAQAPSGNQDIIIGQIHGADDISSVPFVMLHYDSGTIKVVMKQAQSGSTSDKYPLITGVPLGARFDYTISDPGNGKLIFTATYGSNSRQASAAIPAPFKGATVRFQAGAYQQGEGGNGSAADGARLTFFTLDEAAGAGSSAP